MANYFSQNPKSRLKQFKLMYYILIMIVFLLLFVTIMSHYYLNSINSLPNFNSILNRNNLNQIQDKTDDKLDYFKNNDIQKNIEDNGFKYEESISLEIKCEFHLITL